MAEHRHLQGPVGRLARLWALDVNGAHMLVRRAALEMKSAALLLLVVALFDWLAWTVLFNVMFHGGLFSLDLKTALAALLGAMLTTCVIVYERQLLTIDLSQASKKTAVAWGLRVAIIVISALATSQPVDLLLMSGPIQRRIHEEGLRVEALHRLYQIRDAQGRVKAQWDKMQTEIERETEAERRAAEDARRALAERQADEARALAQEQTRNAACGVWRTKMQTETAEAERMKARLAALEADAERAADDAATSGARPARSPDTAREQRRLRGAAAAAERRAGDHRRKLDAQCNNTALSALESERVKVQKIVELQSREAAGRLGALERRREEIRLRIRLAEALIEDQMRRIRDWMRTLQAAPAGELVREDTEAMGEPPADPALARLMLPRFSYEDPAYDFMQRLRVRSDLEQNLPARRPPMLPADAAAIEKEFQLRDPDPADKTLWRSLEAEASLFRMIGMLIFMAATAIPLLTFAFKLMLGPELAAYYTNSVQARAGNPEARLLEATLFGRVFEGPTLAAAVPPRDEGSAP